jgi:hypothetical protein
MAETAEAIGVPLKEFAPRNEYPNLSFEPGNHGDTKQEDAIWGRFYMGDPSAHTWGYQLGARLEKKKPQIEAIDGLDNGDSQTDPTESGKIWISLPASPERLRPDKSVFVVSGDPLNITEPVIPDDGSNSNIQPSLALTNAMESKVLDSSVGKAAVTPATLWLAGALDFAIGASITKQLLKKKQNPSQEEHLLEAE